MIHYYVKSFIIQSTLLVNRSSCVFSYCIESLTRVTDTLHNYSQQSLDVDVDTMESLTKLSNYLSEHIENDLSQALLDKAASIVQTAVSIPESFMINEEDGKQLNVSMNISCQL